MATSTVENYLKQLYLEQHAAPGERITTGKLASAMGVVPGTATSMIKALSDSGLVEYEPRGGVRLTDRGNQLALHVLRRHRLLELFLVKTLGLDWSEVHDEADHLEHAVSDRVLERIDEVLNYPTVDPHGDPIPTPQGEVHEPLHENLANCDVGEPYKVVRVMDQEPEFLKFVDRQGLTPGVTVTVEDREPFAEAVQVRIDRGRGVSLGMAAAAKILVQPLTLQNRRPRE